MDDAAAAAAAKASAMSAFKEQDYETAVQLFKRAISIGGDEGGALSCNLAATYSNLGRHEAALDSATTALRANPGYVKACYRKALALHALKRWDDSNAACAEAMKLNSDASDGGSPAVVKQLETLIAKTDVAKAAAAKAAEAAAKAAEATDEPPKRDKSRPALWDLPMYASERTVQHPPRRVEYTPGAIVRDLSDPTEQELLKASAASAAAAPSITAPADAAALLSTLPPAPQPSEAERRAAAASAAQALAEEVQTRKERMRVEEQAREKQERERRRALNEALAAKDAKAKEEMHARRKQQREEALTANAATVATRAAVAERLAKAVGGGGEDEDGDGEGGGGGGGGGGGSSPKKKTAAGAAAAQARANVEAWRLKHAMPTRMPLSEPRTPSEFTKQYALLRKDPSGLFGYLKLLPAERLPAILSPEVPSEVLVAIAKSIAGHASADDADSWAVPWLQALTKVGRFEMTVMMLDKQSQQSLGEMFDALSANGAAEKAVAALRKSYL